MLKKKSKQCRGCGELFVPEKAGDKICGECRELLALGGTKNVIEFERLRNRYNTRHSASRTYGQFEQHIKSIKKQVTQKE